MRTPGSVNAQVFADSNGSLDQARELGNASVSPSEFTADPGWQSSLDFVGNFSAGFYWVTFSSPTSNNESYYAMYINDYVLNNATTLTRQAYVSLARKRDQLETVSEALAKEKLDLEPAKKELASALAEIDSRSPHRALLVRDSGPKAPTPHEEYPDGGRCYHPDPSD